MGQIVGLNAKPKRCNLNKLSQLGTPAAGEYILVSYDNSMTANGQGNFDRYIMGDGRTAATALELKYLDDSTRPYIVDEVNKAVADIQPIEITGDVTNAPDEEDLTSENQGGTDVLKFKDKAYNAALYSGLGRVYLRKNIVTLEGTGKNVLTQAMMNAANTIYHIQYDYDLNGQTITLPAGCVLEFEGGSLKNGILSGVLRAEYPIDIRCFGLIYNDSSKATYNAECLSILSGLSEINIKITDTLYLGAANNAISVNSISIEGNNNTVYLDGFGGFSIIKDFSISNTKIIGNDVNGNGANSTFVSIQDAAVVSNILAEGCYFSGKLRLFSNLKYSNAAHTKYFENITIRNNTFENVVCTSGATTVVRFEDTNFLRFDITGNIVHNFFGELFSTAITNNSEHVQNILDFYSMYGRELNIDGNNSYNDLDWKPWVRFSSMNPAYFTFIVAELGDCNYTNNVQKNILGKQTSNPTYESYLSVQNLLYSQNHIENCLDIANEHGYNELLKSKGAGGVKRFIDNTFITSNLSESFSEVEDWPYTRLIYPQSVGNCLTIENNTFDIYRMYQVPAMALAFSNVQIVGNSIHVGSSTISDGGAFALFGLGPTNVFVTIENNIAQVDTVNHVSTTRAVLIGINSGYSAKTSVKNNQIKNLTLANENIIGDVCGNTTEFTSGRTYIQAIVSDVLREQSNYYDNIINNTVKSAAALFNSIYPDSTFKGKFYSNFETGNLTISLFTIPYSSLVDNASYKILVKMKNQRTGLTTIAEANVKREAVESDGTTTYTNKQIYYNRSPFGIFSGTTSSVTGMWNPGLTNSADASSSDTYVAFHSMRSADIRSTFYPNDVLDIEIDFKRISEFNYLEYHPTSGATVNRPPILSTGQVGFKYMDTTLGKLITAKSISADGSVTWVDENGYTAALNRGTTAQRPTNLSDNDNGFIYYDTTLMKQLQYYNGVWLDFNNIPAYTYSRQLTLNVGKEITSWQNVGASISLSEGNRPVVNCISILIPSGTAIRVVGCAGIYGSALVLAEKEADESNKHKILEKYGNAQTSSFAATDDAQVYMTVSKEECYLVVNVVNDTNSPKYGNNAETPYSVTIYSNTPFE